MTFNRQLEDDANGSALVLFSPDAVGGLWDPEASALVEDLEDRLGVFVTCAGRGRGALRLDDAASAARFMGCRSMVVIAPDDVQLPAKELEAISERFDSPVIAVQAEWSSRALSEAYRSARLGVPRAA